MNSKPSQSAKKNRRRAEGPKHFMIAVATMIGLVAMLQIARMAGGFDLQSIPVAQGPANPDEELFLNIDGTNTLDQQVYYHGMCDVDRYVRSADTVFVGNSRILAGIQEEPAEQFFGPRGRKFYVLGFPAEYDRFPLEILRKTKAKPEFVIVNADDFFTGKVSSFAWRAITEDRWQARKQNWEATASYHVRNQLHQWFPHLPTQYVREQTFLVFRSRRTGAWHIEAGVGKATDVNSIAASSKTIPDVDLAAAKKFQETVKDWGGNLILTYVPTSEDQRWRAQELAKALDVPLISPCLEGLRTSDGSHLDSKSAFKFSQAMFEELADWIPSLKDAETFASR